MSHQLTVTSRHVPAFSVRGAVS